MRVIARRNFKETTLALLITFFTTTKKWNRRFFRFSSQSSQENKNDEAKSYKQVLSVWWPKNLKSKLHHIVEMINRTLSPQIYLMISFWDQLTEHTSHVLFIASLKSDSSHSPWTDAFSHQRITDTVNTWCIFIKTSILRNESGVGNVWRNSGKLHNRYLFSMKKAF